MERRERWRGGRERKKELEGGKEGEREGGREALGSSLALG